MKNLKFTESQMENGKVIVSITGENLPSTVEQSCIWSRTNGVISISKNDLESSPYDEKSGDSRYTDLANEAVSLETALMVVDRFPLLEKNFIELDYARRIQIPCSYGIRFRTKSHFVLLALEYAGLRTNE